MSLPASAAAFESLACSRAGSVVAGSARSTTGDVLGRILAVRLPTLMSEQTANVRSGSSASIDHSVSDCDSSEMDGTRNSTRPPGPATFFSDAQRA